MAIDASDKSLAARYARHSAATDLLDEAYDALPPYGGLSQVEALGRVLDFAASPVAPEGAEPRDLVFAWYQHERDMLALYERHLTVAHDSTDEHTQERVRAMLDRVHNAQRFGLSRLDLRALDALAREVATRLPASVPGGRSTWAAVDLGPVLSGEYVPRKATILRRADGIGLLYPGLTHVFAGDSGSGKTWLALAATVEVIRDGGRVLYVDFESNASTVAGVRLRSLGLGSAEIARGLVYVRPHEGLAAAGAREAFDVLLGESFDLAVVDGTTDSFAMMGLDQNNAADVAAWQRSLVRRIAESPGRPAVVSIDHMTKAARDKGARMPQGSQHKLSGVDGALYIVDADEPPSRGRRVTVVLRVAKDREGYVLANSERHAEGGVVSAVAEIDSTEPDQTGRIMRAVSNDTRITLDPPSPGQSPEEARQAKVDALDARIIGLIRTGGPQSTSKVAEALGGNRQALYDATSRLVDSGRLQRDGFKLRLPAEVF